MGKSHFAAANSPDKKRESNRSSCCAALLVLDVLWQTLKGGDMSSLAIYLIGLVIFIAGLVYGAHLLHVPEKWIGVGLVVLVGLGVLMGAIKTRQRDSSGS